MNRAVILTVTPKRINCSPAYLKSAYLQYPSGKGFILLSNKHAEVAFTSERVGHTWETLIGAESRCEELSLVLPIPSEDDCDHFDDYNRLHTILQS